MSIVGEAVTDEELVRDCLAGSREAFDRLVERHQRQVYMLCRRFVKTHEDAADLAQDTFVRAYRALASFKGNATFKTWIYRIGVNVCLNRVSLKTPKPIAMDDMDLDRRPIVEEAADDRLVRDERARRVREAIAALPDKQRATLILRAYHDMSHEEIAGVLGGTSGAAKANLFHALKRMRQILGEAE